MAENLIVTLDLTPEIIAALHRSAAQIVAQVAQDIASGYTANAPRATGFMASSAYTVTKDKSTYGQNATTPPKDSSLLPEVEHPTSDQEAIAAVAANYAAYVEYGTSRMGAQPAFHPAVEAAQKQFADQLSNLEKHVKG